MLAGSRGGYLGLLVGSWGGYLGLLMGSGGGYLGLLGEVSGLTSPSHLSQESSSHALSLA